jgi:Protein of unknown function (DUF3309)
VLQYLGLSPARSCVSPIAAERRHSLCNAVFAEEEPMGLILLIVLIVLLLGAIPAWPYSRGWGYRPSGLLGIVLIIVILLLLTGRL